MKLNTIAKALIFIGALGFAGFAVHQDHKKKNPDYAKITQVIVTEREYLIVNGDCFDNEGVMNISHYLNGHKLTPQGSASMNSGIPFLSAYAEMLKIKGQKEAHYKGPFSGVASIHSANNHSFGYNFNREGLSLQKGTHQLTLEVTDYLGNKMRHTKTFEVK